MWTDRVGDVIYPNLTVTTSHSSIAWYYSGNLVGTQKTYVPTKEGIYKLVVIDDNCTAESIINGNKYCN